MAKLLKSVHRFHERRHGKAKNFRRSDCASWKISSDFPQRTESVREPPERAASKLCLRRVFSGFASLKFKIRTIGQAERLCIFWYFSLHKKSTESPLKRNACIFSKRYQKTKIKLNINTISERFGYFYGRI